MEQNKFKGVINWKNQGFAFRLLRSHLLVASVGFIMLIISLVSVLYLRSKIVAMAEIRAPMAQASSKLFGEIQHSLATVRGWVSQGDEVFLKEWKAGWSDKITPTMDFLQKQGQLLKKAETKNLINQLGILLVELEESQWWVNNVAQTPGNEPAKVAYLFEVEPVAIALESIIVSIIQEGKNEGFLLSKEEIFMLSDIEHHFSHSHLQLEKIIFQGSIFAENDFWNNWDISKIVINNIALQDKMNSNKLNHLINKYQREALAFERLAFNAIKLRKSEKWNMAQFLMASETIPLARQIIALLNNLSQSTNKSLKSDSLEVDKVTNIIIAIMAIMVIAMIFIAFNLSKTQAFSLSKPISALSISADKFAKGQLDKDIPILLDDEIGELTQSFNLMRASIKKVQNDLKESNLYLEKRVQERTLDLNYTNESLKKEINEHVKTQKALVNSKEQFLRVFQSSPVVISLSRIDNGLFFDVNESFVKTFGWQRDEVIGRTSVEIGLWSDNKSRQDIVKLILRDGQLKNTEAVAMNKYGKSVNILFSMETIKFDGEDCIVTAMVDITERKQAEMIIKESLKEKEILLSEIHHRVKNNMQVILSLLRLQSEKTEDPKFTDMIKESENRILSMALVHEQLYQSRDFANIDFGDYIDVLINDLFVSHGVDASKITLNIDCSDIFLDIENAIPCGLIINELVSNCLKHAFPDQEKGKIDIIILSVNKDEFELIVSDNGTGIPENIDIKKTESMGLHLVRVLVEGTLEGKIKLDRNHGTRFHFKLKRAIYKSRV